MSSNHATLDAAATERKARLAKLAALKENNQSQSRFDQAPADGQITVETQAAEIAKATAEQAKKDEEADQPIDLFKLQPKKPNWDLKRDLDEKLNTLNVRTQNAIARLVRQRIENAQRAAKGKDAGDSGGQTGEDVGIEGEMLVEGIHVREREDEDERRERKEDDLA
ncbi:hypothetical protein AFLA_004419 [Aspergillus flavus NRRL3357]|nr:hypothetical protein AFLA_004419 [Aspergillus flavus NRRL3357]